MSKSLIPVSNELKDNHLLSPFIRSSYKTYSAVIQHDGNFVLYDERNKQTLWSSGTAGKGTGPYHLAMEDGNLVLYDKEDKMQWSTNTKNQGRPPHKLVVNNCAELRIYDDDGKIVWRAPEHTDDSQWPQNKPMCNGDFIQAQASDSTWYCAGMKSFNYKGTDYDTLIVYDLNDVDDPDDYLYRAGTTPKNGYDNYLFLGSDGTMGIYSLQDESTLKEWDLPDGSNAGAPFILEIDVNPTSLNVYGADADTGLKVLAYSVYPPSS